MSKEPVSYDFEQREYDLDPSKIMNVLSDLAIYMRTEKLMADKRSPDRVTPVLGFRGHGRRMVISGEQRRGDSTVQACDLAELVLSENGQSLDFRVNECRKVTVSPGGLYRIGEQYSRGELKNEKIIWK